MKQILKYPAAVLFGIFILTFFLVDVLNEDRYMSEFENMKLQQKPSFSWSDFADGSFGNNYVTYINHQILGRDNWISLKAAADMGLGRIESHGVTFGGDHYLMEKLQIGSTQERHSRQSRLLHWQIRHWFRMLTIQSHMRRM